MKPIESWMSSGMKLSSTAAWAAAAALTLVCAASSGQSGRADPPFGSRAFLSRHVHSRAELERELSRDPRLIRVYSELLHMSPAQVRFEFARLKLVKLPEEGAFKVYGVHSVPSGLAYSFKVRRLPAGIDVFTLDDGRTPVVLRQCGNLLRGYYSTPGPVAASVPVFHEYNPDAGLTAAPGPSPEALELETPVEPGRDWVEDTLAAAPVPDYIPPAGLTHTAPRAWWPWLFPLIGLPFGGGGSGGGGSLSPFSPIPVILPDRPSITVIALPSAAVPEPGTGAWLLSLCGLGAAWWLRRRRWSARCEKGERDRGRKL